MRDPKAENITGSKQHVFKHEINWSHVFIGLVALLALYQFGDLALGKNEEDGLATTQ